MTEHFHAVVWIDHREARVIYFNALDATSETVHANGHTVHLHHHANTIGSGHSPEDQKFLHQVTTELARAGSILVTGPANAKLELVKHMKKHDPKVAANVTGVEPLDHKSDGELVAHARKFFRAADRMTPQI